MYCVDPFIGFDSDDADGKKTLAGWMNNLASRQYSMSDMTPPLHAQPPGGFGFTPTLTCGESKWPAPVVVLYRQRIEDWKAPFPIGFAYLDGDHTFEGTKAQINAARAAGAPVVCIHDYAEEGGGKLVKEAIESMGLTVEARVERMVRVRL